jgi:hypothetical protein
VKHVREALQTQSNEKFYTNLDKCTFGVDKLIFLGLVVSSNGIEVGESKIDAIKT